MNLQNLWFEFTKSRSEFTKSVQGTAFRLPDDGPPVQVDPSPVNLDDDEDKRPPAPDSGDKTAPPPKGGVTSDQDNPNPAQGLLPHPRHAGVLTQSRRGNRRVSLKSYRDSRACTWARKDRTEQQPPASPLPQNCKTTTAMP